MISRKSHYVSEFGPLWCINSIFHISIFFCGFPLWNFQFPTYYAGSNMENKQKNKTKKTILKQYIETILEAASQDPGLVCLSRKLSISKCVRQK